jgi:hypothetical protein
MFCKSRELAIGTFGERKLLVEAKAKRLGDIDGHRA